MDKRDDRESAPVSPQVEVANPLEIAMGGGEAVIETEGTSNVMTRPPLPWIGSLPRSNFGVMAVVDEEGYLIPLWTAGDLLRACKILWQTHY
jgi:hypothetical protein